MDKALFIAMSGAKHNMRAQTNHANNLANVSTTGFKADYAQARSMPVYYGHGHPSRAYALTENPATNFSNGSLIETGNTLDIAIAEEGFIAVQNVEGNEVYTRRGDLHMDSLGVLRTGKGLPVLGNSGPIAIPPVERIEIGQDGTISIIPLGQGTESLAQVDRIKLVNPNLDAVEKYEDGLFRLRDQVENPENTLPSEAGIKVVSGFLESSNVNAVNEMVRVMSLSRQYEMQVKIMSTAEKNSEASAQLLQFRA